MAPSGQIILPWPWRSPPSQPPSSIAPEHLYSYYIISSLIFIFSVSCASCLVKYLGGSFSSNSFYFYITSLKRRKTRNALNLACILAILSAFSSANISVNVYSNIYSLSIYSRIRGVFIDELSPISIGLSPPSCSVYSFPYSTNSAQSTLPFSVQPPVDSHAPISLSTINLKFLTRVYN